MSSRWETAEQLKTPMEICWQFAYEIDSDKLKALYSKAKKYQWDAEADLDWEYPVDPSRPIVSEDVSGGVLSVPLVQSLSKTQLERLRAHLAAHRLSQFLHGEQGALMTAAALTHAVPDYRASCTPRRRRWTKRATSRCTLATFKSSR